VPPIFGGGGPEIADGISQKIRSRYEDAALPSYLSATSQRLLEEGRVAYRRLLLDRLPIYGYGNVTLLFPWRGDLVMNTLTVALKREGFEVSQEGVVIECNDSSPADLLTILTKLASSPKPDPVSLAKGVLVKERDKHDLYLGEWLLTEAYASRSLDVPATWEALRDITAACARN
jgi:ATP-dependent Lhr-like helicase